MAAQEGYKYEENVAKILQKLDPAWVEPFYIPAGAGSDRPDLELLINNKVYGCELKMKAASAGSLVIYNKGPGKGFAYGDTEGHKEKEFLKSLGMKVKLLATIKREWKAPLFIQYPRDQAWLDRAIASGLSLRKRYEQDLATHTDIRYPLPDNTISNYYNLKDTYYLNVGTHGFYLLGSKDPAGLNAIANDLRGHPIPKWQNSHSADLRIRIQSKGVTEADTNEKNKGLTARSGQGYQITMEIVFKSVTKSPHYNIGPNKPGGKSLINESLLKMPPYPTIMQ